VVVRVVQVPRREWGKSVFCSAQSDELMSYEQKQLQKQIPCGNDNQKGNSKRQQQQRWLAEG